MTAPIEVSARARELIGSALMWDMVWPLEPWCGNDYAALARHAAAGFDVISITLAGDNHNISEAVQRVATARRVLREAADKYVLVTCIPDIEMAIREGKLGIALHFEGTRCFERNLDMVETFFALGIRHTLLAFNLTNSAGGGCAEERDAGLTRFGARLIGEMERVGMLIDLSHTGYRTTLDAAHMATKPVIFSHSNVNAIAPHFRNLKDDQIRACARTDGVVGISGASEYLGDAMASTEAIFRHIDYIANLVGPRHVGLGLDVVWDSESLNRYIRSRPDEWPGTHRPDWPGFRYAQPDQIFPLVERMLTSGYAERDVKAVLGENFRRVCAAVWPGGTSTPVTPDE